MCLGYPSASHSWKVQKTTASRLNRQGLWVPAPTTQPRELGYHIQDAHLVERNKFGSSNSRKQTMASCELCSR